MLVALFDQEEDTWGLFLLIGSANQWLLIIFFDSHLVLGILPGRLHVIMRNGKVDYLMVMIHL